MRTFALITTSLWMCAFGLFVRAESINEMVPNSSVSDLYTKLVTPSEQFSVEAVHAEIQKDPINLEDEIFTILRRQRKYYCVSPYQGFDDVILRNASIYAIARHTSNGIVRNALLDLLTLEREGKIPKGRQSSIIAEQLAYFDSLKRGSTLVAFYNPELMESNVRGIVLNTLDKRISSSSLDETDFGRFLVWARSIESDDSLIYKIDSLIKKYELSFDSVEDLRKEEDALLPRRITSVPEPSIASKRVTPLRSRNVEELESHNADEKDDFPWWILMLGVAAPVAFLFLCKFVRRLARLV